MLFTKRNGARGTINYEGRLFRSVTSSPNAEVGSGTLFLYHESDGLVWAEYWGGSIVKGMLLAKKAEDGSLDMRYQHINSDGQLMTGVCNSTLTILADGRYRLEEKWRWTSGDRSDGESAIEETPAQFSMLFKHAPRGCLASKGFSIKGLY